MKLTAQLKSWMVDNLGMKADQPDAEFETKAVDALIDGTLPREKYLELTTDEDATKHDELTSVLKALQKSNEVMAARLEKLEGGKPSDTPSKSPLETIMSKAGMDGSSTGDVKVKGAWEQYSDTKSAATFPEQLRTGVRHPMAGQPVRDGSGTASREMDMPSELDKVGTAVYFKWALACDPGVHGAVLPKQLRFNGDPKNLKGETHDEQIMRHLLHQCKWGGNIGGEGDEQSGVTPVMWRRLQPHEIKQVIDDTTSGGQYITPIMFDDNVVLPTLLYGEFYPKVTVTPVTRGRRIESGTIGEFTVNSGGGDGTTISLTTTSSFISAFNTTIFTADLGIELGLDFLSDSPVDLAAILTRQAGEKMMQWLDEQICVGDGTTEPEGITVASGTTSVAHSNAAPTVGVYVQHLLNVGKEYLQNTPMDRLSFGGTQTSYRRARSIQVGASDARLIFGNSGLGSYTLFDGYPYGINSNLGNTKVFFGNMTRYRMYRRLGLEMRVSTEGRSLMLDNKMLMIGRFRFGGRVEDGAAFTVSTDAQA